MKRTVTLGPDKLPEPPVSAPPTAIFHAGETTQPPPPMAQEDLSEDSEQLGALVVLWSREEPERVGEVCLFPRRAGFGFTLGRGELQADEAIAQFGCQRPGQFQATGPLRARGISRRQLRLEVLPDGRIGLENLGSCTLLVDGRSVQTVVLQEGDTFALQHELLVWITSRPAYLPLMPETLSLQPFGMPDDLGLVGESPQMWRLRASIAAIAPLHVHVLVLGPSGAGKERVAQGIHRRSSRAQKPLVARSAATLPEGLVTAELFGNIAHYPSHGMPERPGLVGAAQDSTLLLDEFGELPQPLQTQLLRVLDQGEYQRLGETRVRTANFRLIAMTNRDEHVLKHDVRARFSARLVVPDLNERREDIPLLLNMLLRSHVPPIKSVPPGGPSVEGPPLPELSCELVEALVRHTYRTHMRELNELLLESLLERQGGRLRVPSRLKRLAGTSLSPPENVGPLGQEAAQGPAQSRFSVEEQKRLKLFRRFDFRIRELMESGEYPVNRQTADLHLRQLMARALLLAEGNLEQSIGLLLDRGSEANRSRLHARMTTWLDNLRERRNSPEFAGVEGQAQLEKALLIEYRGFREILVVLKWV